jgi:hypothetical protein
MLEERSYRWGKGQLENPEEGSHPSLEPWKLLHNSGSDDLIDTSVCGLTGNCAGTRTIGKSPRNPIVTVRVTPSSEKTTSE